MINIAIIGGGASGLTAASILSTNSNLSIDLYEKSSNVGKKILASGNGRCNISNLNCLDMSKYNNSLPSKVNLSHDEFVRFFKEKNLALTCGDEDGRIYPYSYAAISVMQTFYNSLNDNVHILVNSEVSNVKPFRGKYVINEKLYDYVIVATGSSASLNKKNSYNYLLNLNHTFTDIYPSIHYLYVKDKLGLIENVRAKVSVKLVVNNQEYVRNGEILFKKDHLSGICIFELSTILARLKKDSVDVRDARIIVDFLPDIKEDEIISIDAYFHPALVCYLDKHTKNITDLKHFEFTYDDKEVSIKDAQVMCGGIKINEVNDNLESIFNKNLFIGGEVLDVDGDCGGYNLHFAISSGYRIAHAILDKIGGNK